MQSDDLGLAAKPVLWRYRNHDINGDPWPWSYTEREPASGSYAEIEPLCPAAAIERLVAERDEWQKLATEDVDALQAIGEEFGILGGENRVSGARRILTEQRAKIEELSEALGPFADAADELPDHIHDMVPVVLTTDEDDNPATIVHIGDFQRARQALGKTP